MQSVPDISGVYFDSKTFRWTYAAYDYDGKSRIALFSFQKKETAERSRDAMSHGNRRSARKGATLTLVEDL